MKFQEKLLNFLAFQSGWWACILSVKYDLEWLALVLGVVLTLLQLGWGSHRRDNLRLIAWVLPLGITLDSLMQLYADWTFYGWQFNHLSPFWLWMVWVLFAITLKSSMSFLQKVSLPTQALLGLVMGPLSYVSGAQLGAASMPTHTFSILILALAWAVLTPLFVRWSKN